MSETKTKGTWGGKRPGAGSGGVRAGAGRKQSESFAAIHAKYPTGTSTIRLPNIVLAYLEAAAKEKGYDTVRGYLEWMESDSHIIIAASFTD